MYLKILARKILFEKTAFISNDLGIKQVVREVIEARLKIINNVFLNRDLGEHLLNALYRNLIKNNLTDIKKKKKKLLKYDFSQIDFGEQRLKKKE